MPEDVSTPPTKTANDPTTDAPSYTDALAELDSILRELERTDVDVDHLADRVARATELIALCRSKISAARVRITEVTADLTVDDEPTTE